MQTARHREVPSLRHLHVVGRDIDADAGLAVQQRAVAETPLALDALLDAWSTWMRAGDLAARTIDSRLKLVDLVARRMDTDPVSCSSSTLAEFLAALPSAGTKATYKGDLKAWYQWLVLMDVRPDNPVDRLHRVRVPRRHPRPISSAELARVLGLPRLHRRTYGMLLLGTYEGMRVSEIAAVRGEHLRDGWIRIPEGKGGTDEDVPLHPAVIEYAQSMPRIGWWFPSNTTRPGQHVLGNSVSGMLSKAFDRAGIAGGAHRLRHYFCTESLRQNGGNIRETQELARHASLATTALYTKVDRSAMAATVASMPVPLHVVR